MRRCLLALLLLATCAAPAHAQVIARSGDYGWTQPEMAFDGSGRLHVALLAGAPPAGLAKLATMTRAPGAAWSAPNFFTGPAWARADLEVSPTGEAVTWWGDGWATTTGGAWTASFEEVPLRKGVNGWPKAAIDDNGTVMVAWTEYWPNGETADPPDNRLYTTWRAPGAAWSVPQEFPGVSHSVPLTAAPGGGFWMTYHHGSSPWARRFHDGAWQAPEELTNGLVNQWLLTADTAETPTTAGAVWGGSQSVYDVAVTRRQPDGTWPAPQQITHGGTGGEVRSVTADAGGITVVFADNIPMSAAPDGRNGRIGIIRLRDGVWSPVESWQIDASWAGTGGGQGDAEFARSGDTAAIAYSDGPALKLRIRRDGVWGPPQTLSVENPPIGLSKSGGLGPGHAIAVAPDGHVEVAFAAGEETSFACVWSENGPPLPPLCTGVADPGDRDHDGVPDAADGCPDTMNPITPCPTQDTEPDGCYVGCGPGPAPRGDEERLPAVLDIRGLAITPRGLRIRKLLKAGRHRMAVELPAPGVLEVRWLKGRTVVAAGRTSSATLTMKLTKAGRRALRRAKKVRLVASAVFETGDDTDRLTRPFLLKR